MCSSSTRSSVPRPIDHRRQAVQDHVGFSPESRTQQSEFVSLPGHGCDEPRELNDEKPVRQLLLVPPRHVVISNLVCSNSASRISSIISGIPGHAIEDVILSNIYVQHRGGGTKETAAIIPPELENAYPEPGMFGPMPAHGLYVRHAKNLEVSNFEVAAIAEDARPAFAFMDVQGLDLSNLGSPKPGAGVPVITLRDVDNFSIKGSAHVPDTTTDGVSRRDL